MNERRVEPADFDGYLFTVNRNNFPEEELARYSGKYVAWSLDGTQILASGDDEEEVDEHLRAAGIPVSRVVHDYVEPPDAPALL
jgi:hypothetical protein